jgi:hypothetical protein
VYAVHLLQKISYLLIYTVLDILQSWRDTERYYIQLSLK